MSSMTTSLLILFIFLFIEWTSTFAPSNILRTKVWTDTIIRSFEVRSSRKDELGDKIAKLKKVRQKGRSYDALIGDTKRLNRNIEELGQPKDSESKKIEDLLISNKVVKGKNVIESELVSGRRTIIPDDKTEDYILESDQARDIMGTLMENAEKEWDPQENITSGVGGAWKKPAEENLSTRKPAVSTWGVFERPADISRTFGGGSNPLLRKSSEEEKRMKEEYTRKLLNEFKYGKGGDSLAEAEPENGPKISNALSVAKRALRFGDTYGAVAVLEEISVLCSVRGPLGSQVWLELGMAYELIGNRPHATAIYKKLSRSGYGDTKRNAKQLLYGIEAFEKLKFQGDEESELQKMLNMSPDMLQTKAEKKYDSTYIQRDADGKGSRNKALNVSEARATLREAAIRGGKGISSGRVQQASSFIYERWQEALAAAKREAIASIEEQSSELNIDSPASDSADVELKGAGLSSLVGSSSTLNERLQREWYLSFQLQLGAKGVKYYKSGDNSLAFRKGGKVSGSELFAFVLRSERSGSWRFDRTAHSISFSWDSTWMSNVAAEPSFVEFDLLCLQEDSLIVYEPSASKIFYWMKR